MPFHTSVQWLSPQVALNDNGFFRMQGSKGLTSWTW
jgi:hypothetical protein